MNGEQQVAARRRRTRAEIQQLVAEFVSSGMRRSEFCRSRGLSLSTLDRHLKKRRGKSKRSSAPADGQLVPVELAISVGERIKLRVSRGVVGWAQDRSAARF